MLSEGQLEAIWTARARRQVFSQAGPSRTPVLLLIGAQPGAGKTAGARRAESMHPAERFAPIIGDDLRRFHPGYRRLVADPDPDVMPRATADTSAWMVRRSLRYASENGISVLVEGTYRNPDTPLATARQFDGFTRHAVALGVPRAVSWQGCVARYLAARVTGRPARWTPLDHHNLAYDQMMVTLAQMESSGLFDRLTVIDRAGAAHHDGPGWVAAVAHLRDSPAAELLDEFRRTQAWLTEIARDDLPVQVRDGLDALDGMAEALAG